MRLSLSTRLGLHFPWTMQVMIMHPLSSTMLCVLSTLRTVTCFRYRHSADARTVLGWPEPALTRNAVLPHLFPFGSLRTVFSVTSAHSFAPTLPFAHSFSTKKRPLPHHSSPPTCFRLLAKLSPDSSSYRLLMFSTASVAATAPMYARARRARKHSRWYLSWDTKRTRISGTSAHRTLLQSKSLSILR